MVHVRYNGTSSDFTFEELDVGDLSTDNEIREKTAAKLNIAVNYLASYDVDRNGSNITLRPQAVFG